MNRNFFSRVTNMDKAKITFSKMIDSAKTGGLKM